MTTTDLARILADLPPGFAATLSLPAAAAPSAAARPAPPEPTGRPAASGVLTSVTSASGTDVTLHRAEYTQPDRTGAPTVHGYAWRCPGCRLLTTGYPASGYARAITDARGHHCEGRDG